MVWLKNVINKWKKHGNLLCYEVAKLVSFETILVQLQPLLKVLQMDHI